MLSLEGLMQQLAVLNQKKIQATEFFHQVSGAISIIEELIKTHYPHTETQASQGDEKHGEAINEEQEHAA